MAVRRILRAPASDVRDNPTAGPGWNDIHVDSGTDRLLHGTGNSGTTLVTVLDDQGGVGGAARLPVFNTTDKAMGNAAAAISLFTTTNAALTASGGFITYNVFGTDGTDVTSLSGIVEYSAVNKGGTLTTQITEVTANQAKAVTGAATVTIAWTYTDGGSGVGTVKAAVTTNLTTTTNVLSYTVIPVRGAVTLV